MSYDQKDAVPFVQVRIIGRRCILAYAFLFCAIGLVGCNADTQVLMWNNEKLNPGIARQRFVNVDGRQVECWTVRSPAVGRGEPRGFVLFFVGQGDRVEPYVADIAGSWNKPIELWGMNYPGSGGSQGPADINQVGPDALAVFDAIKTVAGNRPIFVQAWSLGTAPALCVAANRPLSGLILLNPPPLRQLIVGEYSWWNLGLISHFIAGQIPADLDSIANASRAHAAAILLGAGADQTVPPKYQRMIFDAYAGPKRIIDMPGRDHDDDLTPDARKKLSAGTDWMWEIARANLSAR